MSDSLAKGSCLCGQVRYQIQGPCKIFQYCHCSRCRKLSGSAHAANIIIDPQQFQWLSGEELVGRYEVPDAQHFASGFCRQCGSTMPRLGKSKKTVVVPAGSLDTPPEMTPVQNIFWGSRAPWYVPAGDLPQYETLPGKS